MESCFFTSNVSASSIVLVPSTNERSLSLIKKCPRRVCIPTCCNREASSPSEDDKKPVIKADWRTFRARLIAVEEALPSSRSVAEPPASAMDLDIGTDYPTPPLITLPEEWAHEIYEPEKGCLLIATEKLDGVHIFERTVILLISVGPMGPMGIILNRPSLMSIKETRSTTLDLEGTFSDRPLFFGGPLEDGIFLVNTKGGDANMVGKSGVFEQVMDGLYCGTKESMGCAAEMVKRGMVGVERFRFFDGYCGWEKDQLREEITAGYWTVAASSASLIEAANARGDSLWVETLGLMGPRKVW